MKRFLLVISLLSLLAVYLGCEIGLEEPRTNARSDESASAPEVKLAKGNLKFVESYAQGQAESLRQAKPMLLFFTANWCGYCRQMAEEAFTNPQVVSMSSNFVCVLIDADAEPQVCQQFQVNGYPTIQFVSPRGVPLERLVGKQPGHQVMIAMQSALQHVARRNGTFEAR